jgi:hypothetical protein
MKTAMWVVLPALAIGSLMLVAGCGSGGGSSPSNNGGVTTIQQALLAYTASGAAVAPQSGAPATGTAVPAPTVTYAGAPSPAAVPFGTILSLSVASTHTIGDVLVGVQGQTGYYDLIEAGGALTYSIRLSIPTSWQQGALTLSITTIDQNGAISSPASFVLSPSSAPSPPPPPF